MLCGLKAAKTAGRIRRTASPFRVHASEAIIQTTEAYSNFTKIGDGGPVTDTAGEIFERSTGQTMLRGFGFNYDGSFNGWNQFQGELETFNPPLNGW
jgi:hypothetical protein